MTNFRIGQKVVCVYTPTARAYLRCCPNLPKKGGVYTVRGVQAVEGNIGLLLLEIVNPSFYWSNAPYSEHSFHHAHFRPVKTTDISALTALLNPTPDDVVRIVEADVDADMVEIIEAWSKSNA